MRENTAIVVIYQPEVLDDSLRHRLLQIFIEFGCSAEQEVVQVEVDNRPFWLPTGRLLDAARQSRRAVEEVALKEG